MTTSRDFVHRIAAWIVDRPILTMTLVLLGVALTLLNIRELRVESSTSGLIDEGDPKQAIYDEFKEFFGSDILTVVAITPLQGDVFTTETLTFIDDLTTAVYDLEGVTSVQSLTTVRNIRSEGDYLNTDLLVEYVPDDPGELQRIRDNAQSNRTFLGNVVSADGRVATVNIYTDDGGAPDYDRDFLARLGKLSAAMKGDHEVYRVGTSDYNLQFKRSIERDQITLLPLAVLAIFLVLILTFRSPVAVIIPAVTGATSILATVGFMAWMGFPIGVVSVMVPSLLIVVGCTEDVHLITEYFEKLRKGAGKREAILGTMRDCGLAVTLTTVTTVLGFSALALNDITALWQFGIICCFGLTANFVITIVMVPGLLHLLGPARLTAGPQSAEARRLFDSVMERTIDINRNHRGKVAVVAGTAVVFAVLGCFRLEVNNDPITFFKKNNPVRVASARLHDDMAGAQSFNIMIETEELGAIKEPRVLAKIAALQDYLEGLGLFDKVISLADFVRLMHSEMNDDPNLYRIPDSRGTIAEYFLLLEDDDLFRYVDTDYQRANLVVRHDMSGSAEVKRALTQVEGWLEEQGNTYILDGSVKSLHWNITGESILLHSATDSMIAGQAKGLALAMTAVFAVTALLFLSVKAGLIALASNMVPILLNFGLMGWVGIPFNVSTTLVATLALGIAVDDTIHFMVRYRNCLHLTNDQTAAMEQAIRFEGRPIATTSAALALGFAVMVSSQFIPSMHLGFLAALIMIYAMLADFFINPALLMTIELLTVWDFVALKINSANVAKSLIFRGFSKGEIKTVVLLGSLREVKAGEHVVREGDHGQAMYLVLSGRVKVLLDKNREQLTEVATLEEGTIFGEMALLGEGIRTASVVADGAVELLRIDEKALTRTARRNPRIAAKLFANIARVLTDRLAGLTQRAFPAV